MDPRPRPPEHSSPVPWQDLAGRQILLTGGTGFIGCNLIEAYTRAWEHFRLNGRISVLTRNPVAFLQRAPHLARHPALRLVEGDLGRACPAEFPCDHMIHSALEHGDPLDLMERNLRAMSNLLELAHRCGVGRVLFTSSGAVYGPQPPDLECLDEDYGGAPTFGADGAYGELKRASELLGLLAGDRHGFDFLIARCYSFLGPWLTLRDSRAAGNFIANALAGQPIEVKGDGRPWRSYLHGEDLAEWLWTILLQGGHGRPYNVGSDEPIRIADLAERTRNLLAPDAEVRIALEPGPGPAPRYVPSTERARLELGLSARVGLDEAILRTARWNTRRGRTQ